MVKFNELGITRDGRHIIIDVQVRDLPSFKETVTETIDGEETTTTKQVVFLDKIYIVNHEQYADGSSYEDDFVYKIEYGDSDELTSARIVLSEDDVPGLTEDLFFVFVKTKGEPTGDYKGEPVTVGVTYHMERVYGIFMDGMREIAMSKDRDCEPPRWLIDLHLRQRALEAAVEAGDFALACKWWKEFYEFTETVTTKTCNCHG